MTDIIAVVNQKGGVAKTTTTIHVGVALAHLGKKVLLVDLDSQGHLAEGFGIVADQIEQEMSDVFEGSKSKCRTKNILTSIAQFRACYAVGH